MVVCESSINNIMGGIENTGGVTLHNHRRKLKQRFDIIKKLGQGTYGKVQLGINKETGQEVAIKTIKKCKIETEADLIRVRREIQIMSSVQHPNIIHIYEVFENREKMVLVMEYAAGGELYDYLSVRKVLTEDEARRIFRQIATAVYYCHKHKICHRDLKLENILLDENGSAKIADFGLSNVFDGRRLLSTFCGSPLYASPEIVKGMPYHGPEVDCWSLGVLLYTLVYGAMPFDGSNFKRLVKQISQGDYFEPKKPSSASPLIREMLTVIPEKRSNIEKICAHWWVNANYTESCLDIAEELANQTPVRLDLLLSLAPPPPQVGSDQLVIAGESSSMVPAAPEASAPARSQSVGSLMELVPSAERRIRDLVSEDSKQSPKRKLEVTVSTENANMANGGAKRKEKVHKKDNGIGPEPVDEAPGQPELTAAAAAPASADVPIPDDVPATQTTVKDEHLDATEMAVTSPEENANDTDPTLQGAACSELIEEAKKNEAKEKKKVIKVRKIKTDKTVAPTDDKKVSNEVENKVDDKENKSSNTTETENEKKDDTKIPVKRKIVVKKKVLTDKNNVNAEDVKNDTKSIKVVDKQEVKGEEPLAEEAAAAKIPDEVKNKSEEATPPSKPVERRRSKIFETAEKFQNLLTSNESKTSVVEKPKKIFIPGVNVGGFKKEFERKASLTSTAVPDLKKTMSKKTVAVNSNQSQAANKAEEVPSAKTEDTVVSEPLVQKTETVQEDDAKVATAETPPSQDVQPAAKDDNDEQKLRRQNAVNIISNAISMEGTRKSKSRPCMMRKPPVPFGINGRSASGSIGMMPAQFSPSITKSPELPSPDESVKSSCEITLKSATLPRRKTTKAEIQLDYPPPRPATIEFKTEMAHRVQGAPELKSQRSEIIVPVSSNASSKLRSSSLDPEVKPKDSPRERIIPISFEKDDSNGEKCEVSSPQAKPPMPKPFQPQRPAQPQRYGSISRQSTHDSDSEATVSESMEPIRKSPREYIIPIAVEGGGYVTPRAASLEPSDTASTTSRRSMPRFGRPKKMSEYDGSEEDIFSTLHRHNSVGRDSDNEDSKREPFHMHRLRSSRPTRKANLEHADSLSSGEEDDDDGFEILTAENLFSTLLSRVRSLTQRLNVEDNGRLGFPNSRLLGNFDHGSKLWNLHSDPLSRFSPMNRAFHREQSTGSDRSGSVGGANSGSSAPWRRSVSRDLASDIERVFNETPTPTATATLPRDKNKKHKEANLYNLDLSDLKLSEEDALALSYLTPGLSRRIQSQLFSQLPSSRSRKSSHSHSDDSKPIGRQKSKEYVTSDSSESEMYNDRMRHNKEHDLMNDYSSNRLRNSYSLSRASNCSTPIPESSVLQDSIPEYKNPDIKIYRLEDIKKEAGLLDKNATDSFSKYTPYRNCNRSTSLIEPSTNAYKNPLYFRNMNYSSDGFDSKYTNTEKSGAESMANTGASKYGTRPYVSTLRENEHLRHHEDLQDANTIPSRRISRFVRPDFYDNCLYSKERQKREMETQKVLKEIRNKRINEHRERYGSRERNTNAQNVEKKENPAVNEQTPVDTVPVLHKEPPVAEVPQDKPVCNNAEEKKIKREGKISKLIRPKSYPIECKNGETNTERFKPQSDAKPDGGFKSKLFKRSPSVDKSASPAKDLQAADGKKHSNNQLLNSIEKKIRSLYSESPTNEIAKSDTKSRIQSTIRSLREQSEPRDAQHCVTESGLIKRAVSVEDVSTFGANKQHSKTLQPSRKSVTKILGLFKKYEDKEKKSSKNSEDGTSKKSKNSVDGINKKIKSKTDEKHKNTVKQVNNTDTSNINYNTEFETNNDNNMNQTVKKQSSKLKSSSKLPVSSVRNPSAEPELKPNNSYLERKTSILDNERRFVPHEANSIPDKRDLKLNLRKISTDSNDFADDNGNRSENSAMFSPCEESNDSWSVCSDLHRQDMSPNSESKLLYSEEEANESVSDRIRRKSFYCRFNEKKKPRKSSLVNNSFDLKDFDMKYADLTSNSLSKSRASKKDYGTDIDLPNKAFKNQYSSYSPAKKEARTCRRAMSVNDNYYSGKYRETTPVSTLAQPCSSQFTEKLANAHDKSSAAKSKRSLLQAPASRIRERIGKSPSPLNGSPELAQGSSTMTADI